MTDVWFGSQAADGDWLLQGVTIVVLALLVVTAVFSVGVIVLHMTVLRRQRRRARLEEAWLPEVLDVLGGFAPPEPLIARIKPSEADLFLSLLLEYATIIRGSERARLAVLAEPFCSTLERRTQHWDASVRALAVFALGMLNPRRHEPALARALHDPSTLVAITAAQALARERITEHFDTVLVHLYRFEQWGTSYLTSVLMTMGPEIAPLLVPVFADPDQPRWIRLAVAEALRWLNYLPASETVTTVLQTETDREILAASLRLLRRIGRPAQAELARPLCTSDDAVLRIHAVSALAALGNPEDVDVLVSAIDDPSRWVAIRAVRGLRETGRQDLLRTMATSDHPRAELIRQVLHDEVV